MHQERYRRYVIQMYYKDHNEWRVVTKEYTSLAKLKSSLSRSNESYLLRMALDPNNLDVAFSEVKHTVETRHLSTDWVLEKLKEN